MLHVTQTSHIGAPVQVPLAPLLIQLPVKCLGRQWEMGCINESLSPMQMAKGIS